MAHQFQALSPLVTRSPCIRCAMTSALAMLGSGVSPLAFSCDHSVSQNDFPAFWGLS